MEKEIGVTIKYNDVKWHVKGVYYPEYLAPRECGLPIEPDEPESFEVRDVYIVHDGKCVPVPFDIFIEEAIYDLGEKALKEYQERMGAAEEDYFDGLLR